MDKLQKVINTRSKLKNEFLDIVEDFKKTNRELEQKLKQLKIKETELKNKVNSKLTALNVEYKEVSKKKAEAIAPYMKTLKELKGRMNGLTKKEKLKLVDIHQEIRDTKEHIKTNEAINKLI